MFKQIKFIDDDNVIRGGIIDTDTNTIICGCCGGTFELDEIEIIDIYDDWVDLTYAILGD